MDPMQAPNQPSSQPPEPENTPQPVPPMQPMPGQSETEVSVAQPFGVSQDQPSVPVAPSPSQIPPSLTQPEPTPIVEQPIVTPVSPMQPQQPVTPPQQQTPNPFSQATPIDQSSMMNANADAQPVFSQPQPVAPTPTTPAWKRFILPVVIIVGIIVLAVGGYFAYNLISSKVQKVVTTNSTDQVAQSTQSSAPDINTLKSFTMLAPDASKTQGMTAEQAEQATRLVSADNSCTLIYGIETQAQLPGTDIGDVISQYLAKVKQTSPQVVVNGPNKAAALVLSGTDGKSYSLPTVSFTYTNSAQAGAASGIYSVSELSGGNHAVVASICGSDTAKNPSEVQAQLTALEAAAATIKVQVQ